MEKSQEDYLRVIYLLSERSDEGVISVEIADNLGISKPSVSEMLKKLARQGLIKSQPYSRVAFTAKGYRQAVKLTYKHRVIEVFLHNILKVSEKNIHKEAHLLEHCISDQSIKKLARFLNNPKYCPDGKTIPRIKKT